MANKLKLKKKKEDIIDNIEKNTFLIKAKLALYMESGMDIKAAAKLCNVNDYQLGLLRTDPEFEEFIEFCSYKCEHTHLSNIEAAGNSGQWQASAWILERLKPERYSKKDTVRHEYELKLVSFQRVILDVINTLEPTTRQQIMQKLRSVNTQAAISEIQISNNNGNGFNSYDTPFGEN